MECSVLIAKVSYPVSSVETWIITGNTHMKEADIDVLIVIFTSAIGYPDDMRHRAAVGPTSASAGPASAQRRSDARMN